MNYLPQRFFIVIVCAFLFSSCDTPATPAPCNMAFVDIPEPANSQAGPATQVIPTAISLPTPQVMTVSLSIPSLSCRYVGEDSGRSAESIACSCGSKRERQAGSGRTKSRQSLGLRSGDVRSLPPFREFPVVTCSRPGKPELWVRPGINRFYWTRTPMRCSAPCGVRPRTRAYR